MTVVQELAPSSAKVEDLLLLLRLIEQQQQHHYQLSPLSSSPKDDEHQHMSNSANARVRIKSSPPTKVSPLSLIDNNNNNNSATTTSLSKLQQLRPPSPSPPPPTLPQLLNDAQNDKLLLQSAKIIRPLSPTSSHGKRFFVVFLLFEDFSCADSKERATAMPTTTTTREDSGRRRANTMMSRQRPNLLAPSTPAPIPHVLQQQQQTSDGASKSSSAGQSSTHDTPPTTPSRFSTGKSTPNLLIDMRVVANSATKTDSGAPASPTVALNASPFRSSNAIPSSSSSSVALRNSPTMLLNQSTAGVLSSPMSQSSASVPQQHERNPTHRHRHSEPRKTSSVVSFAAALFKKRSTEVKRSMQVDFGSTGTGEHNDILLQRRLGSGGGFFVFRSLSRLN